MKKIETAKTIRVPSFTIKRIEHDMTIIDADQGIAEVEDDIFNRISDYFDHKNNLLTN